MLDPQLVLRELPEQIIAGLNNGTLTQWGGVIRDEAGRIVKHLTFPGSPVEAASEVQPVLGRLTTQQMVAGNPDQALAALGSALNASAILAGVNLAVTAIGFVVINSKLNRIDATLLDLKEKVVAIKDFVESRQRAGLVNALDELEKMSLVPDVDQRRHLLHQARQALGENVRFYETYFARSESPEEFRAFEDFFLMTAVARSRASAEAGLFAVAHQEALETLTRWESAARRFALKKLIKDDPQRLLTRGLTTDAPAARLCDWLDWAYEEGHGWGWIDRLREEYPGYYAKWSPPASRVKDLEFDRTEVVPTLNRLLARRAALESHAAQFELMARTQTTPSEMEEFLLSVQQDPGRPVILDFEALNGVGTA